MEEKYEAHAYLKFKGEEGKDTEHKKLLSALGQLLFEAGLTDVYNKGIEFGCGDPRFMIKLTDFFVTTTAAFHMSKKTEEEIIRETSLFLDAVKQDVINSIRDTFTAREQLKF